MLRRTQGYWVNRASAAAGTAAQDSEANLFTYFRTEGETGDQIWELTAERVPERSTVECQDH